MMAMVLLPLIVVAETWYDASTRSTWLYSEKLGDTPGRWGGLVCELREGEVEIGPGARHQNVWLCHKEVCEGILMRIL